MGELPVLRSSLPRRSAALSSTSSGCVVTDFDSSAARKRSASEESAPTALSDRVQSLRLPSHYNQGHGTSRLPWILCLLFAGAAVGMGVWVAKGAARPTEQTE